MNIELAHQRFNVKLRMPKKFSESVIEDLMSFESDESLVPLEIRLVGQNSDGTERRYGISYSYTKLHDVLTSFANQVVFDLSGTLELEQSFPENVTQRVRSELEKVFSDHNPEIEIIDVVRFPINK